MEFSKIDTCQKLHQNRILDKANVVSVGYGYKIKDGKRTEEPCLMIGVAEKVDVSSLSADDLIPGTIDGVKTDVVKLGNLKALPRKKTQTLDPTSKFRPAPAGVSIGHKNITAGTFGCVVQKNGELFILSNNHVLANSNDAKIGDAIFQPGPYDGGTSNDQIGTLEDFIPIKYIGDSSPGGGSEPTCKIAKGSAAFANFFAKILGRSHRLMAVNTQADENNFVDAALARPLNEADISDETVQIGKPVGTKQAVLGMQLQKYGRTTKYTTGEVLQLNATVRVSYGTNKLAQFSGQIVAGAMSDGGDSGSAVLDMEKNLVGLLYAGSDTSTILNPIDKVFEQLGVTL